MMNTRTLAICAVGVVLLARGLGAQELLPTRSLGVQRLAEYRNFALGSDLATVSTGAGIAQTEAKTIHQRPALMQDLQWRPLAWISGSGAASTDPVEQIVFSFYDNQLFRVAVAYARDRTEGMTDADMVEAISRIYGTSAKPSTKVVPAGSQADAEFRTQVARWADAEHAVVLYRSSSYSSAFELIVTDVDLERLARKAEIQATRLDDQEAPAMEKARQKKELDDRRAVAEKARVVNKRVFRP